MSNPSKELGIGLQEEIKEEDYRDATLEPAKKKRNRICFSCGVCRRRKVKVCNQVETGHRSMNRITNIINSAIVGSLVKDVLI